MDGQSAENKPVDPALLLQQFAELLRSLYAQTPAADWGLSLQSFTEAIARSLQARQPCAALTDSLVESHLLTLHASDLALACACCVGSEAAWEYFLREYSGYLRACASALLRGSRSGANGRDLADSLYAELYGLRESGKVGRSLFEYFHGRSSLKTWLRTILAQRHVDLLRKSNRNESLTEENEDGTPRRVLIDPVGIPEDPHRSRYLRCFTAALEQALSELDTVDRERLSLYYAKNLKLRIIGVQLREHESSVSRHLERTRNTLRRRVEQLLASRDGKNSAALSPAEIALCFRYAAEDVPIDFSKIFPAPGPSGGRAKEKEPE